MKIMTIDVGKKKKARSTKRPSRAGSTRIIDIFQAMKTTTTTVTKAAVAATVAAVTVGAMKKEGKTSAGGRIIFWLPGEYIFFFLKGS